MKYTVIRCMSRVHSGKIHSLPHPVTFPLGLCSETLTAFPRAELMPGPKLPECGELNEPLLSVKLASVMSFIVKENGSVYLLFSYLSVFTRYVGVCMNV